MSGFHGTSKAALFTVSENMGGYAGKPSSGGFTPRVFHGIDKRGKDAARDAFVRFVRPRPVKIAVSVVSKGERVSLAVQIRGLR